MFVFIISTLHSKSTHAMVRVTDTEKAMISQTAEYALRAVVHLASFPDTPKTARQLADATRVSHGYLSKVMLALGHAHIVHSQRGIGGGFHLTRPASQISVLDVVNAVDPIKRINVCPLGLPSHGKDLCPLHRKLDEATAMIEHAFKTTTVEEILKTPGKNRPLCEVLVRGKPARSK